MSATYDFYDADPATRQPKIIQEEFRYEAGVLYIKASGTINREDLCQHYTRLATNQHDLHQQGLKALIYDLREIDPNIPFVSLFRIAQQARQALDFDLMRHTLRVFIMNSSREVGLLQMWLRLSRKEPMRICTTTEKAYALIEHWPSH